jgi:predicted membrane protein
MIKETNDPVQFGRRHHNRYGVGFAFVLMAAGLVFLLVNTGIIPSEYKHLLTAWPIWIVLAGLFSLFHRNFGVSAILLTIGIFFLVPYFADINPQLGIPFNFTNLYWPLLLIIAGIFMVVDRLFCKNHFCCSKWKHKVTSKFENEDGFINIESAFDSRKNIFLDPVFKGGNIESSFGEVVLDLRKTSLPEGNTVLNVEVSFGSATIIVPSTWNVKVQGDAIFGTFSDHRLTQSFYPDEPSKLTIKGKVSFGECEVRD